MPVLEWSDVASVRMVVGCAGDRVTVGACKLAQTPAPSVRFHHHGRRTETRMATPARGLVMLMTVDEYLVHPSPEGVKTELVRGELRLSPSPGIPHGCAVFSIVGMLMAYVRPCRLGRVFGDSVGYELVQLPRTVRVPDASFVRADRVPPQGFGHGTRLFDFAPDLAVEVMSPSETASQLQEKLDDFLSAGTTLIWVVDPVRRTVRIVSTTVPETLLHESDTMTGGHVLPEFSCVVEEIFDDIARE